MTKIPKVIRVLHSAKTATYEIRIFSEDRNSKSPLMPADIFLIPYQNPELLIQFYNDLGEILKTVLESKG